MKTEIHQSSQSTQEDTGQLSQREAGWQGFNVVSLTSALYDPLHFRDMKFVGCELEPKDMHKFLLFGQILQYEPRFW